MDAGKGHGMVVIAVEPAELPGLERYDTQAIIMLAARIANIPTSFDEARLSLLIDEGVREVGIGSENRGAAELLRDALWTIWRRQYELFGRYPFPLAQMKRVDLEQGGKARECVHQTLTGELSSLLEQRKQKRLVRRGWASFDHSDIMILLVAYFCALISQGFVN